MTLNLKSMTPKDAETAYTLLKSGGFLYRGADKTMRGELHGPMNRILSKCQDSEFGGYLADLECGLALYSILPPERITLRQAADDGVWRHLSLETLPDLVHARWGDRPVHYWKLGRRIWLKTLWWYIHLSWQGSGERTRAVLSGLTTDEIIQLVERPGNGYRTSLSREIMRRLKEARSNGAGREIFRTAMKLNTALLVSTEPEFAENGTEGYVRMLFDMALSQGRPHDEKPTSGL